MSDSIKKNDTITVNTSKESEDKEYEESAKRFNKFFRDFWYNRIYSFRNVCMRIEENRFRNLVEINKRIEENQNKYGDSYFDDYSTEEEVSEVDYNYDTDELESDSN